MFGEDRYFDVFVEYAKGSPEDVLVRISVHNRGPEAAELHVLPTLWFRNTWTWNGREPKPELRRLGGEPLTTVEASHHELGKRRLYCEGTPELLFTENESNLMRLFKSENYYSYVKDAFHDYVIHGNTTAVNPANVGTKVAAYYGLEIAGKKSVTLRLRLRPDAEAVEEAFGPDFDAIFAQRIREANQFYSTQIRPDLSGEQKNVAADHADIVERLTKLADAAREDLGDQNKNIKGKNVRPLGVSENPPKP